MLCSAYCVLLGGNGEAPGQVRAYNLRCHQRDRSVAWTGPAACMVSDVGCVELGLRTLWKAASYGRQLHVSPDHLANVARL